MGEEKKNRENVILYPSPGFGHLLPMVELARVLIGRYQDLLNVTILVLSLPFDTGSTESFVSSVIAANPLISFHFLPPVDLSHLHNPRFDDSFFGIIELSKLNVLSFLSSLRPTPLALVVDFFCTHSADIATQLGFPSYIFFTCCASVLVTFLHFPKTIHNTTRSLKDMGKTSLIHFPGIVPIPVDHIPIPWTDREDRVYKTFLKISARMAEVDGILINTFDSLESKSIQSLPATGAFARTIYPVGPLIMSERGKDKGGDDHYFEWLDMQPTGSVVFLCFGTMGTFSPDQLKEIATGLERSKQRFLWVVKNPPHLSDTKKESTTHLLADPSLDLLFPDGFLERTKDKGLVVKSWVRQVAVLRHEAIGCFVTHLGWNSVLEAICAGVRMIGWPLYAEQRLNKLFVVDEMKLAIAMEGYNKELVTAAEVERTVGKMMMMEKSEAVDGVKERCSAMKLAAESTLGDGGDSMLALDELVRTWGIQK